MPKHVASSMRHRPLQNARQDPPQTIRHNAPHNICHNTCQNTCQHILYVFSTRRAIHDLYARISAPISTKRPPESTQPHTPEATHAHAPESTAPSQHAHPLEFPLESPLESTPPPPKHAQKIHTPPTPLPDLLPALMPKAITIGELFSLSFFTPEKINPSQEVQRVLLQAILRECLPDDPALAHAFIFEKSFLGYLEGSDFLLPFFRELAQHGIDIATIPQRDIYADYEECLEILEGIYTRFSARLDELGLARLDEPQAIVPTFLQHFARLEIMLDGILSPQECQKLYAMSCYVPLHIHIATDRYNYKYFHWLCEGIEPDRAYIFRLDSRGVDAPLPTILPAVRSNPPHSSPFAPPFALKPTLESATPLKSPPPMELYGFELRLGQCGFVLEKVRELLRAGVRGEEIIIVTPDEGFSEYFALLDSALNLNYAMGRESLLLPKYATWYKLLREALLAPAIIEHSTGSSAQGMIEMIEAIFAHIFDTKARARESSLESTLDSALDSTRESSPESRERASTPESKTPSLDANMDLPAACIRALAALPPCPLSPKERAQILGYIFDLRQIAKALQPLGYEWILGLVLLQIERLSTDDTQGGKVRVMGILETRGIACEYAIVVDCNHGFIPRIKDSDVFLNTAIRQSLGMPTLQDRENLQKHYYEQLFANTRKGVFLTATINEESRESSLIDELALHHDIKRFDGDRLYALFPPSSLPQYAQEEIVGEIAQWLGDFHFSSTSLNTLIACRRRFYLRYVLRLLEPDDSSADGIDSKNAGILVHEVLERALRPYCGEWLDDRAFDMMERECERSLRAQLTGSALEYFACEQIWRMLGGFWQRERQLARESGLKLLSCEQGFHARLSHGSGHFMLTGKLDRIDMLGDGTLRVLDYKWAEQKAQKSSHNLQLAFYKLALESSGVEFGADSQIDLGQIDSGVSARIYYLKSRAKEFDYQLDERAFEQAKATILEALELASGRISFDMTQEARQCVGCSYVSMCNRA